MKRLAIIISILMLFSSSVFAEKDISVFIDETPITFDVPPVIQNDRTFVPMRKIFEVFGCDVEWIEEEQVILATKNSEIIMLKIGSNRVITKDIETDDINVLEADVAPFIENGRTLVPLRCISELLFCTVEWIGESKTIFITS